MHAGAGGGGAPAGPKANRRGRRTRPNHPFNARHVRLNAKICQVSDRGDVWELLVLAELHQAEMNCVNLSTILHRVARLAKRGQAVMTLCGHPQLHTIRRKIEAELVSQEVQIAVVQSAGAPKLETDSLARCWSTIAWSYATLQIR